MCGPLAFIVAAHHAFEQIDGNHPLILRLRIDSDANRNIRDQRLIQAGQKTPRKQLDTILSQYLPSRVVASILHHFYEKQDTILIGQLSKVLRLQISELL